MNHAACMGEIRNADKSFHWNAWKKNVDMWEDSISMDLNGIRRCLVWNDSAEYLMAGCYEHGNEISASIKCGEMY
jgi:hypothetical protein